MTSQTEGGASPPVITVNGQPITEAEIRLEVGALRAYRERDGNRLSFEQRLQLRNEAVEMLIERTLLFHEARRLKLTPTQEEISSLAATLVPKVAGGLDCRAGTDYGLAEREALRRIVFESLIAYWGRNVKPPKSAEIRDYYRAHEAEFRRPEMVHAAHIVKHCEGSDPAVNRTQLEQVRERLLAGEDFASLAKECSDCPEKGGDLGFYARGAMVEEFDAVIFDAPVGEVTPVFETRFGVHLAVVLERRPAGLPDLRELTPSIADALYRGKQDKEVGRRLQALHNCARIQEAGNEA